MKRRRQRTAALSSAKYIWNIASVRNAWNKINLCLKHHANSANMMLDSNRFVSQIDSVVDSTAFSINKAFALFYI